MRPSSSSRSGGKSVDSPRTFKNTTERTRSEHSRRCRANELEEAEDGGGEEEEEEEDNDDDDDDEDEPSFGSGGRMGSAVCKASGSIVVAR